MRRLVLLACLMLAACSPAATAVPTATLPPAASPVPPTATPALPTSFPTAPAGEPISCNAHDLVYHDRLQLVLLVNCVHEGAAYQPDPGLLWGWDGAAWRRVSDDGPTGRSLGGAAYDSARDQLLLLGGRSMLEDFTDFWRWDSTGWQRLEVPGPEAVSNHFSMVYAAARDRVVLYGGQNLQEQVQPGTWEWDGQRWQQAASTGPSLKVHYALTYDALRQQVLLLGEGPNQLYAWDGQAWNRLPATGGPPTRAGGRMALHAGSGMVVMFGGFDYGAGQPFGDTWLWDGTAWAEYTGPAPSNRSHHALAYDPLRDRVVLYGGYGGGVTILDDTWEWDGHAWACVARCE